MLTEVTEGAWVHQSSLLQNNSVVVQGRTGVLVVDPGITDGEMACLATDLRGAGQPVVAGFATHPDWDHVLWHSDLGDAARFGTARCAAEMKDLRAQDDWTSTVQEGLPPEAADEMTLDLFGLLDALPPSTTHLPWDGPGIRIIEHPAHAPGHAALLVEDRGVLIAGDMLSDLFVPMLGRGTDDPIEDYLTGLRLLDDVADDVDIVVPGHGSVGGDVRARIDQDRAYLEALRSGGGADDPRVQSPAPGWEWVSDIHAGQAHRFAESTEGE